MEVVLCMWAEVPSGQHWGEDRRMWHAKHRCTYVQKEYTVNVGHTSSLLFPHPSSVHCSMFPQRSQVKGWNMKGGLSLGTVPGLNIDLPPQTILDIELVKETTVSCLTYLLFTNVIVIALSLLLARWGIHTL